MNPPGVTLDEAAVSRLAAAANGGPVPVLNPAGEVIGYHLTPAQMAKAEGEHQTVVAWLDHLWPPEEIARIAERLKDESRPKRTMEEVLRLVEGR